MSITAAVTVPYEPATESWVTRTPGVVGGDACIRDTRISVWGLVEARRLGLSDVEILARVENLSQEDLAAAWEYAGNHPDEIEAAIIENRDA